ncbi:MAG TPA: PilZ domain-containing protein [Phycisphaerae bacterium]|nr:PilZ domain-containing protein [Phycisphaerales bacterium]HNO76460.1 PilZ domain-containing protein [Phycisphaerae bacterium]
MDTKPSSNVLIREVLLRFLAISQRRCDSNRTTGRRAHPRHNRTWPLAVIDTKHPGCEEAAALHDASNGGIAFLYRRSIDVGSIVRLRLFWSDADSPLVPAVVRHRTLTDDGFLIGCEYLVSLDD